MDRLLGGLLLSIPTMVIMLLISVSITCPRDRFGIDSLCYVEEPNALLYVASFLFMFVVGAYLGAEEIQRQASASYPVCPNCGHKVGFVRHKPTSVKKIKNAFNKVITCEECGVEYSER